MVFGAHPDNLPITASLISENLEADAFGGCYWFGQEREDCVSPDSGNPESPGASFPAPTPIPAPLPHASEVRGALSIV